MASSAISTSGADPRPPSVPSSIRKKVNRRDPQKRKEQNRQSQKTYREKQKRRLEELERLAALTAPTSSTSPARNFKPSEPPSQSLSTLGEPVVAADQSSWRTGSQVNAQDTTDPSLPSQPMIPGPSMTCAPDDTSDVALATAPLPSSGLIISRRRPLELDLHFLSSEFDRWLQDAQYNFPSSSPPPIQSPSPAQPSFTSAKHSEQWTGANGSCSCPGIHTCLPLSIPASYKPILPISPSIYDNNLRIDMWCALSGMLENCLHLGVTKAMFCADDSQSPFFRINANEQGTPEESQQLVRRVRKIHGAIKYDLRPMDSQILAGHHPYIDVLPFRDLRENLISHQYIIDEDEFLLDFLNNATCWGGVRDAGAGTGCPWDSRSWEANENFLKKWWNIVGGEDGELTRTSRWWREMRGERVTEVF